MKKYGVKGLERSSPENSRTDQICKSKCAGQLGPVRCLEKKNHLSSETSTEDKDFRSTWVQEFSPISVRISGPDTTTGNQICQLNLNISC